MKNKQKKAHPSSQQATTTPMLHKRHPCYNCPLIRVYGNQPYCYSPRCIRGMMEEALRKR